MRHIANERGQASFEYLLVGLVLIALMGAFAALWQFFSAGSASALIESSASHAVTSIKGVSDALLF